jgi:hypothetical protein
MSSKKERRAGKHTSLVAKRNSQAGAWLPGVSVSLVFDEERDEINVSTQLNATKAEQSKAKKPTQRHLV